LLTLAIVHWLAMASAAAATLGGVVGFYYMYKLYRIPARPYWDHWQTGSSFVGTALVLGSVLILLVATLAQGTLLLVSLLPQLGWVMVTGLVLEGVGLLAHARDLKRHAGEGAASHFEQRTQFGNAYVLRNILLLLSLPLVTALALGVLTEPTVTTLLAGVALLFVLTVAVIGRALFYVLVIPTTMPGAFFWKNRGFQEHARETGLANMPQVGVVPDSH